MTEQMVLDLYLGTAGPRNCLKKACQARVKGKDVVLTRSSGVLCS